MKLVPLSVSLPPHVKSAAQPRSALSVWRLQARPPIGRNRPITARPGRQLGCDTRVGGLRGWAGCVLWSASDQLLVTNQLSGIRVCHSRVVGIQTLSFPFLAAEPQANLWKNIAKGCIENDAKTVVVKVIERKFALEQLNFKAINSFWRISQENSTQCLFWFCFRSEI